MWKRHLLFAVVCLAGLSALTFGVLKSDSLSPPQTFEPQVYQSDDFQQVVDQVDKEFAEAWSKAKLKPAPRASDLAIARRLSLGLTGTIPSLEEIRGFEAQPVQDRLQFWASHILEDRRYADFVAERLARAYVGVEGGPFILFRRRRFTTWLSDQIMANRPYDELVHELIAGNGVWTTNPAINFITVTIAQEGGGGPDEIKLAARVTRAFLGVRLDCVQCHDDQLGEDWLQRDFHQLAAFFAPVEMGFTGAQDKKDTEYKFTYHRRETEQTVNPVVPFNRHLMPQDGELRDRLANWVTHDENKPFARAIVNRVWAMMFGRPLVEPIDEIPLKGSLPPGMETLATDLVEHDFDLRRLVRVIMQTRVYQLDSRAADDDHPITREHEKHWAAFPITRLRPEQVIGAVTQAASLETLDADSNILVRIARGAAQNNFITRYGDTGEDEFDDRGGTIPQRLLMMNGNIVSEQLGGGPMTASTQIANFAPNDKKAIETAYLVVLTRRPTADEQAYFLEQLKDLKGGARQDRIQDLYWALFNSTGFSWNH